MKLGLQCGSLAEGWVPLVRAGGHVAPEQCSYRGPEAPSAHTFFTETGPILALPAPSSRITSAPPQPERRPTPGRWDRSLLVSVSGPLLALSLPPSRLRGGTHVVLSAQCSSRLAFAAWLPPDSSAPVLALAIWPGPAPPSALISAAAEPVHCVTVTPGCAALLLYLLILFPNG